jgi:hypothetical protein
MHAHEVLLATAALVIFISALARIVVKILREDVHSIRRDLSRTEPPRSSPKVTPYDAFHVLFPKQNPLSELERELRRHPFGYFVDGSLRGPGQLGVVRLGCVNCGISLTAEQYTDHLAQQVVPRFAGDQ